MAVNYGALQRKVETAPPQDAIFSKAFAAARAGYSDVAWESLAPRERTEAIYREMRRLDQTGIADRRSSAASRRLKLVAQAAAG